MKLYEILVPCQWNNGKPIRRKHHQEWDSRVREISGGLTVMKPAIGQWVHEGDVYKDRTIPVRIMCSDSAMERIASMTIEHYEQLAVMYHVVSNDARVVEATADQVSKFLDCHK